MHGVLLPTELLLHPCLLSPILNVVYCMIIILDHIPLKCMYSIMKGPLKAIVQTLYYCYMMLMATDLVTHKSNIAGIEI